MNLLAVDIGNTDIKFALFEDDRLAMHWRATGTQTHPERFSALLRDSLARTDADFDALVYTSVVPSIEAVFRKTMSYCFHVSDSRMFIIDPARIRLPLDFQRYAPGELGMDRLVNACSAHLLYPETHIIAVDFGTATTLDLVSQDGQYLGGAITPGWHTFLESLPAKTAKLPYVAVGGDHPSPLKMGQDTVGCLQAGLGIGYRGLMKELLREARQEFISGSLKTVATGGLAETVIQACSLQDYFQEIDPLLTLKGLHLLYRFNRQAVKSGA